MIFSFVCLAVFVLGSGGYAQDAATPPSSPALTSFSCHGRPPGYYADLDAGCKIYHVCDGNSHFTYICPRRTLFQQRSRTCDHSYLVRCKDSDDDEDSYSEDEAEILLRLADSEESRITIKGISQDEYIESTPTETTEETTDMSTTTTTTATTLVTTDTPLPEIVTVTVTNAAPTEVLPTAVKKENLGVKLKKYLKVRLKDFRSLFYIPEVDNSIIAEPEREFVLAIDGNDFLNFRNRREGRAGPGPCPTHCDSKFFLPGSCHPCIRIK